MWCNVSFNSKYTFFVNENYRAQNSACHLAENKSANTLCLSGKLCFSITIVFYCIVSDIVQIKRVFFIALHCCIPVIHL